MLRSGCSYIYRGKYRKDQKQDQIYDKCRPAEDKIFQERLPPPLLVEAPHRLIQVYKIVDTDHRDQDIRHNL
jgi:hypothetical protein